MIGADLLGDLEIKLLRIDEITRAPANPEGAKAAIRGIVIELLESIAAAKKESQADDRTALLEGDQRTLAKSLAHAHDRLGELERLVQVDAYGRPQGFADLDAKIDDLDARLSPLEKAALGKDPRS